MQHTQHSISTSEIIPPAIHASEPCRTSLGTCNVSRTDEPPRLFRHHGGTTHARGVIMEPFGPLKTSNTILSTEHSEHRESEKWEVRGMKKRRARGRNVRSSQRG